MNKLVCIFNNTDIAERAMSAVRKMIRNQSRLNRNIALLNLVVTINAIMQENVNIQMKSEISKLKYEVEKLKQQNGD